MKKLLLVVFACMFALCSFAACSSGTPDDGDHNKPTPTPPEEQTKTVQDGGNYTVVGNYVIVTEDIAAQQADPATAEVAFGKTSYFVSTDLNKILLVTAINNAEGLSKVSALGYAIDGFTAAEGDMAVTDKYFSTLTVGANAAKTAKDLALNGADEASKLLVWEIAYSAENGVEFSAEATVIDGESTKPVLGTEGDTKVKLTYMNEDDVLGIQTLNCGQLGDFSMIEVPSKAGYKCIWATENGTSFMETTPVTETTVVYASFEGIKIEQVEAAEAMGVIEGDKLIVPANAQAVQSDFYKNEYTLAWKLGDTAIEGTSIALDDFIGETVDLVCVATNNDDPSDVHTVYTKSYTFREVPVYDLGNSYPTDGTVFYQIPYDRETYGALKSSMLADGDGTELGVWTSEPTEETQTIFMKTDFFTEYGANTVLIRFENAVVRVDAYKADSFIGTLEVFDWYNGGGTYVNKYVVLTADIEFKVKDVHHYDGWLWCPATGGVTLKENLDGAGHKITLNYTQEVFDAIVAERGLDDYSSLRGVFPGIEANITIKNVYFDVNVSCPQKFAQVFGYVGDNVTFDNCVFDIDIAEYDDGRGDGYIFGTSSVPAVKNSLFINRGSNNLFVSQDNLASLENCVFINVSSVTTIPNNEYQLANVFNVAANVKTSFWVFDILENAIAGTFADAVKTGYGTAPADGAASFSHEASSAKALGEIFKNAKLVKVTAEKITFGSVVVWQKTVA